MHGTTPSPLSIAPSKSLALALVLFSLGFYGSNGFAQPERENNWLCMDAPNRDMAYHLIPNREFSTLGVPFRTNQFGFRDQPVYQKDVNTFRILCLGDSVTFGTGVRNEETFPNVLEAVLSRHGAPNKRIDVINAGVSAYNIRNIRGLLEEYVDDLQPDLIVYTFVENDLDDSVSVGPGGWLMALDPAKSPEEPYVSDDFPAVWLMRRKESQKAGIFGKVFSLFDNPLAEVSNTPPPLLFGDHLEAKRRWSFFQSELNQINQICRQVGSPFLVLSFALSDHSEPVTQKVLETCQQLGIPHASSLPLFHQDTYMRDHSLGYDPHFNSQGHQLMADRLLCFLIDQQTLPADFFGKPLPHNHFSEAMNRHTTDSLRAKALEAPSTIDLQDGEGVLGMLAGVDTEGRMARYSLFRLGGTGDLIRVTASDLMGTRERPQDLRLEVEGESIQSPGPVSGRTSQFSFALPQRFWNRNVEIRLVAGGPVWIPTPSDRLKGVTPQSLRLYKIERASSR